MGLKQWLKERSIRKDEDLRNNGYDYATGALLRGDKTPCELEAEQDRDSLDAFDYGMDAAILRLVLLGIVKDNRI